MYCPKCGALNDESSKYCQKCGEALEKSDLANINENQHAESYSNTEKESNKLGIASLILGIISLLTSLGSFRISILTGIVGLILGIKSKVKKGVNKAGIVLSSIGLVLTVLFIIVATLLLSDSAYYYGDGYSLKYDKNWSIVTLSNGQEALKYKNESSFLIPVGKSPLSGSISNFDTTSGQKELYQIFYDLWNNDVNNSTINIYSGSNGFSKLTDDIYYATYTYGVSATQIKGKYILLVSPEKNAILSFMTNASENVEENDKRAIESLKNINIIKIYEQTSTKQDDNSDGNVIYDDELYDFLNSLRNWNAYSELRTGNLGKIKSINGGWRILSDSEVYWKFEDGQFWWYKSLNDLDDNYWYGTTQILIGKAGMAVADIDENKFDAMISNSSGKITENDVYTIVCTPTKFILNGVDKSNTDILEGITWTYICVLVDHGTEGIEAQVLDPINADIKYYVKIAD